MQNPLRRVRRKFGEQTAVLALVDGSLVTLRLAGMTGGELCVFIASSQTTAA